VSLTDDSIIPSEQKVIFLESQRDTIVCLMILHCDTDSYAITSLSRAIDRTRDRIKLGEVRVDIREEKSQLAGIDYRANGIALVLSHLLSL